MSSDLGPSDIAIHLTAPRAAPAEVGRVPPSPPASAAVPGAPPISARPNPAIRLDGALGLVVIEFRDASGAVTSTIPSERQLAAYRQWEQMHTVEPGTAPDLATLHLPGTDAL
jgi:hypothetical protein